MSSLKTVEEQAVVRIGGSLQAPTSAALSHEVRALLLSGKREIVVDLADVSEIDAAGLGELARVYNMATAQHAALYIANARGAVRDLLARVGLLDLLNHGPDSPLDDGSANPTYKDRTASGRHE